MEQWEIMSNDVNPNTNSNIKGDTIIDSVRFNP